MHMGNETYAQMTVENFEKKIRHRRYRCTCEDNIKMDILEEMCEVCTELSWLRIRASSGNF
jgi:hypothetical protein